MKDITFQILKSFESVGLFQTSFFPLSFSPSLSPPLSLARSHALSRKHALCFPICYCFLTRAHALSLYFISLSRSCSISRSCSCQCAYSRSYSCSCCSFRSFSLSCSRAHSVSHILSLHSFLACWLATLSVFPSLSQQSSPLTSKLRWLVNIERFKM